MARKWNTKSVVIAALRKASRYYPLKAEALKKAKRANGYFQCAQCERPKPRKDVQVDHIHPVVDTVLGWQGYESFIERLFCPLDGLQVLCVPCHKDKSVEENAKRRAVRKERGEG